MNDAKLEKLIKPLIKIFDDLELELIKDIAIRLNTYDGIKGSLKWYLDKLQDIGGFTQDSLILLAEYAGKTQKEVKEILRYAGYDISKLDKYKPFIDDDLLITNPASLYESVAVQNIINTAIKETNSIMETIQTKALESAKESYMKILTDSYIKVSSGVYSYDQSIKQGLKELAQEGFTGATYKNGKKLSLESTVRRDILTKCHQLAGEVELEKAKELNTNLVYVTQHLGARIRTKYTKEDYEAHFEWQGKVYMLEGSNEKYDNFYEKTGYGELLGLCGVNCRHHFYATTDGRSHPELFDEKENEQEYLKQQEQRKYERKIRQLKREKVVAKQLDDKEKLKSLNSKSSKLNKEYTQFLEENNLKRDYGREYIEKELVKIDNLSLNNKKETNNKVNKEFLKNIKGKNYISEIEKYENEIFKNKNENAIIIEENGDMYKFKGSNDYVNIECNYKNVIITHNHPTFEGELGGSFSEEDFRLLIKHQNIKQLRAVDEKYIYTTRVLTKIKEYDYMEAIFNVIPKDDEDFKHLIFEELKKKGLVEYERKLRD